MNWHGVPQGVLKLPKQVHGIEAGQPAQEPGEETQRARGTFVLVLVFLAAFITYYFVNWKLLSFVWKVG